MHYTIEHKKYKINLYYIILIDLYGMSEIRQITRQENGACTSDRTYRIQDSTNN